MNANKFKNEIYCRVDEEFISRFGTHHREFMKKIYYDAYCNFCEYIKRKPLPSDVFFTNMRRRRIILYQLCCPYCGTIHIMPNDKKIQKSEGYNYCVQCGHSSTVYTLVKHLSRFIRISSILELGLRELKKEHKETEDWLLGYDCYQMELIELASIIEVVCRECFEALVLLKNIHLNNDYARKVIMKSVGNDFMNIEKASKHYKKALGINLRDLLDKETWDDLIDIVNLRNMMVHNNGMVDEHFMTTVSYERLKVNVEDILYRLDQKTVYKYFSKVMIAAEVIINTYIKEYTVCRHNALANYYFNISDSDSKMS